MIGLRAKAVLFSALSGLLFGYDLCVISVALEFVEEEFALSTVEAEAVVSFVMIGAVGGCLAGGPLADAWGRRRAILLSAALFALGAVAMGLAGGLGALLAGRVVVGAAVGLSSITVPVYVSELAPPALRGLLVSVTEAALCAGCLASVAVDEALRGAPDGWRWMLGVAAAPALLQLAGMLGMPESPAWLRAQGRAEEAARVSASLGSVSSSAGPAGPAPTGGLRAAWRSPAKRRMLLTSVGAAAAQNLAATNALLYYSVDIMERAGYDPSGASNLAIAGMKMAGVLLALWLVRRAGRRQMLLAGTAVLGGCHLLLSFLFLMAPAEPSRGYGALVFATLLVFVLAWNSTWAPLMWVVCAELQPAEARATGMGVAIAAFWGCSYVVNQTLLSLLDAAGEPAGFLVYGLLSGCCGLFVFKAIPEMRGKSLAEIEALFSSSSASVPHQRLTDSDL